MTSNQGMPAGSPNGGEQWIRSDHSSAGSYSEFPSSWSCQLYLCICFLSNYESYALPMFVICCTALERFNIGDPVAVMTLRNGSSLINEHETRFTRH